MTPDDYDPIAAALKEDLGNGDITTEFFVPEALQASGRIVAREPAVVAGRHDPVANGEGALFGYERVVAKPAGDSHVLAGASVEISGV